MGKLFFNTALALAMDPARTRSLDSLRAHALASVINNGSDMPIPISSIPIKKRIVMAAYIRACADESLKELLQIGHDQNAVRMSPIREYSYTLIQSLFTSKVIRVKSANTFIQQTHDGQETVVIPVPTTSFLPNISDDHGNHLSLKSLSKMIEEDLQPKTQDEVHQVNELWIQLALQESMEYLNAALAERDLIFNAGEKTEAILLQVLSKYSTSQAFYFIYSAAKNAADFILTHKVSHQHAANTIPGKIQRLFDRSICEGWRISKYHRNLTTCPISALSNVLYDKALGLSNAGFDAIPGTLHPDRVDQNNG